MSPVCFDLVFQTIETDALFAIEKGETTYYAIPP